MSPAFRIRPTIRVSYTHKEDELCFADLAYHGLWNWPTSMRCAPVGDYLML